MSLESSWQSEEGRACCHLNAHCEGNLHGTPALITIISPVCVCVLYEHACVRSVCWQAVVSQCVCLCKCTFVLLSFLSICQGVYLCIGSQTLFVLSHTDASPHLTPPPYCWLFIYNQAASVTEGCEPRVGVGGGGRGGGRLSCQRWAWLNDKPAFS